MGSSPAAAAPQHDDRAPEAARRAAAPYLSFTTCLRSVVLTFASHFSFAVLPFDFQLPNYPITQLPNFLPGDAACTGDHSLTAKNNLRRFDGFITRAAFGIEKSQQLGQNFAVRPIAQEGPLPLH